MTLLLCTDMDRTLLPNGQAVASDGAIEKLKALLQASDVKLVYVTGRDKQLVEQAIAEFNVPQPDYVIADVGTSIYQLTDGVWSEINEWADEISNGWQGKSGAEIDRLIELHQGMRLQEPDRQKNFKLSYYVEEQVNHEQLIDQLHANLALAGLQVNIIWSVDDMTQTGLVDILPAGASKYDAIRFLMDYLGVDLEHTVFAGDSGNDISVLASPLHAVLVANASQAVKETAIQLAEQAGLGEFLYVAQGDFLGMNGNYCAGILEGIAHYMPYYRKWMESNYGQAI